MLNVAIDIPQNSYAFRGLARTNSDLTSEWISALRYSRWSLHCFAPYH